MMRTLLKMSFPVDAGNQAIKDGSMQKAIQTLTETLRPEASYYYPENGKRTALYVFDMKDSSQIPQIAEPLFMSLKAEIQFFPVMNAADLKSGLEATMKAAGRVPVAA
jgi:hypothetical protein